MMHDASETGHIAVVGRAFPAERQALRLMTCSVVEIDYWGNKDELPKECRWDQEGIAKVAVVYRH